jgi:integrase
MASIQKRGAKWFAQVCMQGVRKSATFSTKSQAKAWGTQIESEILAGKHNDKPTKTLLEALERYAEEVSPKKRGTRWELIRLNAWKRLPFVHYKLDDVTTPRLAEWRDERLKTVQPSTVNREMNLLSSVFEQARREWQWTTSNPTRDVRRPPQPKHRDRIFTDIEIEKIAESLGYESCKAIQTKQQIIATAFFFALETAMRREEITGLEWTRVDLGRKVIILPQTKNGDARHVPLSKKAGDLLQKMQQFDSPFPVNKDVLSTLFRRACLDAKIENARFHDARATALTRLANKLTVLELARMVGHRDPRSLMIYYRESAESLAAKLD